MSEMELKSRVSHVLKTQIAPALALDSEGIEVLAVQDGIATVRLTGVCAGCPATLVTVIAGLEQELRRIIPEVEILEAAP